MSRAAIAAALSVALLLAAVPALGEPPPGMLGESNDVYQEVGAAPRLDERIFDAVLLRPLGAIQLGIGALVFAPAYPVSLIFGGGDDVMRACITEPYRRTFQRPLGRL